MDGVEGADGIDVPDEREFRPVTSVLRTVQVLEALAVHSRPQTLGALARQLDVPKSTLHGILRTLEHTGWLETDETGLRFGIGARSRQLGASYADDVVERVGPALDRLATITGETVQLARLTGSDVVYLARRDSTHPVRLVSTVGGRLPAHCTAVGRALLAHYPDAEVDRRMPARLQRMTDHTLTSREQLHSVLDTTRQRGWAMDDQEVAEGLRCYAVALLLSDPPIDAVSVAVPTFRISQEREQLILRGLREAQEAVAAAPTPRGARLSG